MHQDGMPGFVLVKLILICAGSGQEGQKNGQLNLISCPELLFDLFFIFPPELCTAHSVGR